MIRFEGTQDRVLAAWGGNPLAPASSLSVQAAAGETAVLRFRGEWGPDSFVEAELFFEIQEASERLPTAKDGLPKAAEVCSGAPSGWLA